MPSRSCQIGLALVVGLVACSSGAGRTTARPFESAELRSNCGDVPGQWLARRLRIQDLDGLTKTPIASITHSSLGRRSGSAQFALSDSVQIQTRCGDNYCVDGLFVHGRELITPLLSAEEEQVYGDEPGSWLERAIVVAWQDDSMISVYVAESEFSGGAHSNDHFSCRTFEKKRGGALRLSDLYPSPSAGLLLEKASGLLEQNVAIDVFGQDLAVTGFEFGQEGFRFAQRAPGCGSQRELVLCGEGPYPSQSNIMLELRLEAIP